MGPKHSRRWPRCSSPARCANCTIGCCKKPETAAKPRPRPRSARDERPPCRNRHRPVPQCRPRRWRPGAGVRPALPKPDLPRLCHPLPGPGPCLSEPLHPCGHGTGLPARAFLRRHRPMAAVRHPWRGIPSRHGPVRRRPPPGRPDKKCAVGKSRPGGLGYCARPPTRSVVNKPPSLFRSHFVSDSSHEPGWERATLEKLAFATLNEQRSIRRWRTFFRLVWLVLIVSIALVTLRMLAGLGVEFRLGSIALVTLRQTVPGSSKSAPHTAMVDIRGEIAAGADASAEFVVAAMRSALENDGSQALVLLINSPGGSPVQAGIINEEIRRLKPKHNKQI